MAGTEAGVETVANVDVNSGCGDEDDANDENAWETADAVCLDVGWTVFKPEH